MVYNSGVRSRPHGPYSLQSSTLRLASLVLVLAASACDITDPPATLVLSGTVVAASDGGGFTAGQPIEGAEVQLRYRRPLELTSRIVDIDITTSAGAFSVEAFPQSGNNEPDCFTLTLAILRVGFTAATSVRVDQWCEGAGVVEGVVVDLEPVPTQAN